MRLVVISDTHNVQKRISLPGGDVLVCCGDVCEAGRIKELEFFNKWLKQQHFDTVVFCAGNHDRCLDINYLKNVFSDDQAQNLINKGLEVLSDGIENFHYLFEGSVEIDGAKFYGAPHQPFFHNYSFNLQRGGDELKAIWDKIPEDTDILLTHCPPHGILDKTYGGESAGCELLRERIEVVKPSLHMCGHIHESRGLNYTTLESTWVINASMRNYKIKHIFSPIVVDFDTKTKEKEIVSY